jgi:hypothetical protein
MKTIYDSDPLTMFNNIGPVVQTTGECTLWSAKIPGDHDNPDNLVQLCRCDQIPCTVVGVFPASIHVTSNAAIEQFIGVLEERASNVMSSIDDRQRRMHSIIGKSILRLRVPRTHRVYDYNTGSPTREALSRGNHVVMVAKLRGVWANETDYGIVLDAHASAIVGNHDPDGVSFDDSVTITMPRIFTSPQSMPFAPPADVDYDSELTSGTASPINANNAV